MIIDTNEFEIGDEVWIVDRTEEYYPMFVPIFYGMVKENFGFNILVYTLEGIEENIVSNCHHTQQECQLACDRLNGVNHD